MISRPAFAGALWSWMMTREQTLCSLSMGSMDLTTVPVISVIDDDASVRAALNNLLKSLGYVVHAFPSAEAFLQSADLNNTWCAIADVRMPGMSGVDLQSRLRAQGSRLPFVFITAVPEEGARARAFEDGAICFLTKPFDEDSLIACLGKALAWHLGGAVR
jgi:FixJ family two-component response regulator